MKLSEIFCSPPVEDVINAVRRIVFAIKHGETKKEALRQSSVIYKISINDLESFYDQYVK